MGKVNAGPKPLHLKFGLNRVTTLVEEKKAKLVVIAHDVEPIEIMTFLPALCRKNEVPFCFIRGKARLGKLVHTKTATCVALTDVKQEDKTDPENLRTNFRTQFNDNTQLRRTWGGGIMGIKNQHMMAKRKQEKSSSPRRPTCEFLLNLNVLVIFFGPISTCREAAVGYSKIYNSKPCNIFKLQKK